MIDERNFRSSYYEKVGFRSVEEKRSLEMLLRDSPLDKAKLKQFCLRFTVPAIHRDYLWKILLDIVPLFNESREFVAKQRKIEFQDLRKALKVARIVDDKTKSHQMLMLMWMLKTRTTKININAQLEQPIYRAMCRLAESLWNISEYNQEEEKLMNVYWILNGFLDHVQKFVKDVNRLQEYTCLMLEREDRELHNHLTRINALNTLPYEVWFCSCFATIICDCSITKIWDKIAVGAYKILVYVSVVMFMTIRRFLLRCETLESVLEVIDNITEETSEVVVNKAIELWQQSGSTMISSGQNSMLILQNS